MGWAWASMDLSGQPRMLLGRRKSSKRFDVNRVEIHMDLFDEVRSICRSSLAELDSREAKPYFPFATATADDYLELDITNLPQRHDKRKKNDAALEPAAALSLVADTDRHVSLTAAELRDAAPSMYAFSFKVAEGYVGFIRNTSPRRRVNPGLRFLKFEDTLRRMESPDLAIDDTIDLVVTPSRIAILSLSTFNTLFGDVRVAFEKVPEHTGVVANALANSIPLSAESVKAIGARCERRVVDAKRLNHIATERSAALAALKTQELTELLSKRGLKGLVKSGNLHVTDESASEFLDVIEGRLFEDDLTREPRRADSYSPRILKSS